MPVDQAPSLDRPIPTGLAAIYLDPTEPSRFAALTYTLVDVYALYGIVLLMAVHRTPHIAPGLRRLVHGIDIAWTIER